MSFLFTFDEIVLEVQYLNIHQFMIKKQHFTNIKLQNVSIKKYNFIAKVLKVFSVLYSENSNGFTINLCKTEAKVNFTMYGCRHLRSPYIKKIKTTIR